MLWVASSRRLRAQNDFILFINYEKRKKTEHEVTLAPAGLLLDKAIDIWTFAFITDANQNWSRAESVATPRSRRRRRSKRAGIVEAGRGRARRGVRGRSPRAPSRTARSSRGRVRARRTSAP